jgi:signal transduction histidine kinase
LEVIAGEVERLSGIVEELLDFSRMQGGHLVMKFARSDVSAELGEAVVLFRDRASRESIELLYIEPENLPPVVCDHDRLKQVFINIIENAIKYSNPGGRIRIETADMGSHVQVVISDTGVGVAKDDLPNIKKKFYKANRSRPGSGIGLALADEIIRRHKGRLEIDSEEGIGTTVTITLPVAPNEDRSTVGF